MTDLGLRDEETGMSRRGRKGSNSALFACPAYQNDREGLPYGCAARSLDRRGAQPPGTGMSPVLVPFDPLRGAGTWGPGNRGFAALTPRLSMVGPLRGPTGFGSRVQRVRLLPFPMPLYYTMPDASYLMSRPLTLNPASTPQADDCRPLRARHVGCGRWRSSCSPRRSCCERRHVHNSRHRHPARRPRG